MKATSVVEPSEAPQLWKPHAYQVKGIRWLLSHNGAGLFLDPGLGKTSITLAALGVLKEEGFLKKGALVVAPLRPLYNVWDSDNPDSETRKWTNFHHFKIAMLHGDDKAKRLREKADIYLINPDGLRWLAQQRRFSDFDVLVIDESTLFKHVSTQRFKTLREYLPRFQRRWILTGTPSPNGLLDLFGQIYICDLGNALGRWITHYRRQFFNPTGYGGYTWTLQDGAEERIYRAIEPLVLRMSEEDYLKLPPLIGALAHAKTAPSIIGVDLPKAARKTYDQLEELFFTELADGSVTASNAGVKSIKLRQVANGGIYLDKGAEEVGGRGPSDGRRWSLIHDAKSEAVCERIEERSATSTVISFEFHHDLERMRQQSMLKNMPAIGEGSMKDDTLLAQDWNRGKLEILAVNPASFARGSNMQRGGDALIFHSMTYNFEHYDQLIRRFWRQGRKKPFFVDHIIANDTVDLAMVSAINRKNRTQKSLLDALRRYSFRRPKS